jgi:hypothetical protein
MNWIEVPAGAYKLVSENARRSHCQLEFHVRYIRPDSYRQSLLTYFGYLDMTVSYRMHPKDTGLRLHPYAFSALTSNAQAEKEYFLKLKRTQSFRLPIWSLIKVCL